MCVLLSPPPPVLPSPSLYPSSYLCGADVIAAESCSGSTVHGEVPRQRGREGGQGVLGQATQTTMLRQILTRKERELEEKVVKRGLLSLRGEVLSLSPAG